MIITTNHFESFYKAVCHYNPYMFKNTRAIVANKIETGEIVIGEPIINKGDVLILNDGKYSISSRNK